MSALIVLTIADDNKPPTLLVVDAHTDEVASIRLADRGVITGALALTDDRVVAGVFDPKSHWTSLVGVLLTTRTIEPLGAVDGDAKVQTVTPDNKNVVLLQMVTFRPVEAALIGLPTTWRRTAPPSSLQSQIVWLGRAATAPQSEALTIANVASFGDRRLTWQTTTVELSP